MVCGKNSWIGQMMPDMTPEGAYRCALDRNCGDSELEAVIATDAMWSFVYARNVLRGRFELGEPAIATSPEWAYCYAKNVLGESFELGEPAIATLPYTSYGYAERVIRDRFELGEGAIARHDYWSLCYGRLRENFRDEGSDLWVEFEQREP